MRQWTFILPGVELASEVLVFLGSNRSGVVKTTWISPLADDATYGPARKNSQLVGVTLDDWNKNAKLKGLQLGHHELRHVLFRVPCRVPEHHIERLG